MFRIFKIKILFLIVLVSDAQQTNDPKKLLKWCLDSKHHKVEQGPENELFEQCSPWKDRSCCNFNTSQGIHRESLYDFNYDHCAASAKLSAGCRRHFMQDQCFYECSPNVGPWVVKESRSWRDERFYKVPLCASDCNAWFEACRFDYTCTDNWSYNFEWVSKKCPSGESGICEINICPSGARCETFEEIYGNAMNFCQRVWDDIWVYTPDNEPCMRLWFNGSLGNPNDRVANIRAQAINSARNSKNYSSSWFSLLHILFIFTLSFR